MPRIQSTALVISVFYSDPAALQIGRLGDALRRIDEHETMAEATMQKHRNGAERPVIVARSEIGRAGYFRHVEFAVVQKTPVARR
jgi:hypothetical protein